MAKKTLTLEQSLSVILSEAKAKVTFATAWQRVLPFLMMLEGFFPKYNNLFEAVIAGVNAWLDGAKLVNPKFIAAWNKIKPFLMLLKMFGKKVWVWVNAVIVGIDKYVEGEE